MQQWSPDLKDQGGRSLYGAMLRQTRLALETGGETRLRGVLWYQGESDSNPEDAAKYLDRMSALIQSIREDFAAPSLPFLFVQLGPFANTDTPDPASSEGWDAIREAQRILPSLVPGTAVVPAVDLDLDDAIHIGTLGLKRLGNRLANVALNRVYGRGTPDGITLGGVTRETPTLLRVSYDGVSTGLRVPDFLGRVSGYAIGLPGRIDPSVIFKAQIDPMHPNDVLLHLREELPAGATLWYGRGFNPFCQLTDAIDMAVPAMGPLAL
jgi:sialate O-acetylesterase